MNHSVARRAPTSAAWRLRRATGPARPEQVVRRPAADLRLRPPCKVHMIDSASAPAEKCKLRNRSNEEQSRAEQNRTEAI